MPHNHLGAKLIELGWHQGCIFKPPSPIYPYLAAGIDSSQEWAVATKRMNDMWIVASQTCDIAKKESEEPFVEVLRVFSTTNEKILGFARGKSVKMLLVRDGDQLVADATARAHVLKETLVNGSVPILTTPYKDDLRALQRFQAWLARRYDRPAVSTDLVESIHRPIVVAIEALPSESEIAKALKMVSEIRYKALPDAPNKIELLFLLEDEESLAENTVNEAAALIAGWLTDVLKTSGSAKDIVYWDTRDIWNISLGEYLLTEMIYLDHLSG